MVDRWVYCAAKDHPEWPCAWPNCTCGLGEDDDLGASEDGEKLSFAHARMWHSGNSSGPDVIMRQSVEARRRAEPWGTTPEQGCGGKRMGFWNG